LIFLEGKATLMCEWEAAALGIWRAGIKLAVRSVRDSSAWRRREG